MKINNISSYSSSFGQYFLRTWRKFVLCAVILSGCYVFLIYTHKEVVEPKLIRYDLASALQSCDASPIERVEEFFDYLHRPTEPCFNIEMFGGRKKSKPYTYNDGEKYVCFDSEYLITSGNCTVLSFGISNDWSFDDAFDDYGCKVYSFDPTIKKKTYNRSNNIQFFHLGLSDMKGMKKIGKVMREVDTYEGILEMLNLKDKYIDYLKMDIEGSELNFFQDVFSRTPELLLNVKQFGLEIHPGYATKLKESGFYQTAFNRIVQYFKQLECLGFKIMSVQKNMVKSNLYKYKGETHSTCYEIVFGRPQNTNKYRYN